MHVCIYTHTHTHIPPHPYLGGETMRLLSQANSRHAFLKDKRNIRPRWVLSQLLSGNFPESNSHWKKKKKISKQLEDEATAQVKSKLGTQTQLMLMFWYQQVYFSVLRVTQRSEESCLRMSWVSGSREAPLLLVLPWACESGFSYCQGNEGSRKMPEYWPEGKVSWGSKTRCLDLAGRGKGGGSTGKEKVGPFPATVRHFSLSLWHLVQYRLRRIMDWSVKVDHTRREQV